MQRTCLLFYMLAHKQPTATAYCLKHVRKRYAEAPVIVFENGSNVLSDICASVVHGFKALYHKY